MATDSAEFVRWLYRRSGAVSQRQFSIKAGMLDSQVSAWVNADGAPSAYNLLKLMRAAGVLDAEFRPVNGLVAAEHPVVAEVVDRSDRLAELQAAVDLLLERTADGFEQIDRRLDEIAKRLPGQDDEDDQQETGEC